MSVRIAIITSHTEIATLDYSIGAISHREQKMDSHIYRVIELVGASEKSIEDAVNVAIGRAHKTIRNLRWFDVVKTSGQIEDGKVKQFQVTLKVGFTMEDSN